MELGPCGGLIPAGNSVKMKHIRKLSWRHELLWGYYEYGLYLTANLYLWKIAGISKNMKNLGPISLFPKTSYNHFIYLFFFFAVSKWAKWGGWGNPIPNIIPNLRKLGESQWIFREIQHISERMVVHYNLDANREDILMV